MRRPLIRVLIDLPEGHPYRAATLDAVGHAGVAAGADPCVRPVPTARLRDDLLGHPDDLLGHPDRASHPLDLGDGVILGPGTPYKDPEAAHEVIRMARARGVPLVGT